MDWTMLPTDVMKNLLLIIIRTDKPVKMTSGHVVVLSSQSFVSVSRISMLLTIKLQITIAILKTLYFIIDHEDDLLLVQSSVKFYE